MASLEPPLSVRRVFNPLAMLFGLTNAVDHPVFRIDPA